MSGPLLRGNRTLECAELHKQFRRPLGQAFARLEIWWVAIGPIVMTVLLTRVSGVPLLERSLTKRREGYDEYIRTTSSFIPMPRRRR